MQVLDGKHEVVSAPAPKCIEPSMRMGQTDRMYDGLGVRVSKMQIARRYNPL